MFKSPFTAPEVNLWMLNNGVLSPTVSTWSLMFDVWVSSAYPSGDYNSIDISTPGTIILHGGRDVFSGSESSITISDGNSGTGFITMVADDDTANFGMNIEPTNFDIGTFSFSAAGSLRFRLGNSANDTSGPVIIDVNSDQYLLGTSGGGNLWGRSLHIKAEDNVGNGGNGGDIWLNGGIGDSGQADGNVILANSLGKVGISNTAPDVLFHIGQSGGNASGYMRLTENVNGGYSDIYIVSDDGYLVIDPSAGANPYVLVGSNSAVPTSLLSVAGNAVIGGTYFSSQIAPADGLLVEGNVGIGTNTINGKVNVQSNAGSSGLIVTGYSSGADGAYNYIKGVNASNGKTMFVIGDDSGNLQGTLCFFGESASYPVIGEFDFADRSIAVADKRIFTYQGWKDGSGNYVATLSMRKNPFTGFASSFIVSSKLNGSVLIHGSGQAVSGVSILDVGGNVSIGSYAETNAAPTNGMIVSGSVGFGVTSVTAKLHIGAVGTAASSAPLKFTTGTVMTTAEAGAMEYATPDLFFTPGSATRYNLPLVTGSGTQGDLIYASGASIYSRLAKNTTATRYLANTGTSNNPAWAQIDLTNGVTGALPVANGGTGSAVQFVDNVALTNQGADITTTNFANGGVAGTYRVSYYLEDTTADATAGAVTLTLAFTDAVGATTITANQLLTSTGRTSGVAYIQLASGNVTYAVAHTGIFGTAKYALYLSLERLS